jgi:hypothetical protein
MAWRSRLIQLAPPWPIPRQNGALKIFAPAGIAEQSSVVATWQAVYVLAGSAGDDAALRSASETINRVMPEMKMLMPNSVPTTQPEFHGQ